jgi:hypothetical protein
MRITVLRGLALAIPMIILGASSASAAPDGRDEICGARQGQLYGRTLWGLCTAAVGARCDAKTDTQQCETLALRWQRLSGGVEPPWLASGCGEGGTCTVFVTSTVTTGSFGGLDGGDTICRQRANADGAVVPAGVYRAWLSTSTVDAKDRVLDAPYVLPNGASVAVSLLALTDGGIDNPIDVTELGAAVTLGRRVWTGTPTSGRKPPFSTANLCDSWTTQVIDFGVAGEANRSDFAWTDSFLSQCGVNSHSLYCFQVD